MKSMVSASSPVFTGTLTTLCFVIAGALFTSLLLQFTSISESSMPYFTYSVNGISLLIGGLLAGKKGGHKGWYYGGLTGIAYFIIIAIIGFLAFDVSPGLQALYYLVFAFFLGAFGGIFGVNLSNK